MFPSSGKQPNSAIRMVILFASVFAIVGVIFAIVQSMDMGGPEMQTPLRPTPSTRPVEPIRPAPGESEAALTIREGVPKLVGTQGKIAIRNYSPDSDVPRLEFKVREWKPTGRRKDEMEAFEPEIRLRTPGGQEIRVVADYGVVQRRRAPGGTDDLRRGRLEGNVVMDMDTRTTADREALPPELRDAPPGPENLIRAELEDLRFDLETSRVETAGRFRAQGTIKGVGGSIEGVGLAVRYDEVSSRIEQLEIDRGVQIVLRGAGRSLEIALPGASTVDAGGVEFPLAAAEPDVLLPGSSPASPPLPAAPAEPEPEVDGDGVPILLPDGPRKPKVHPVETYRATFEGGVVIEETAADGAVSCLESETLEFLFDVGQRLRAAADTAAPPAGADTPSQPSAADASAESEVTVTWSGRFLVDFLEAGGAGATGDRLHVVAEGQPVHLRNRLGQAICTELEFHNETRRVWLRSGVAGEEVTVSSAGTGQIVGREVFFDRDGGRLHVAGPGHLSGRRSPQDRLGGSPDRAAQAPGDGSTRVRFDQDLTAAFEQQVTESIDEVTGKTVVGRKQYLRSARVVGDVLMSQDRDSIAAEEVEVLFRPPAEPGSGAGDPERLTASENVRLAHGDDSITCRAIEVFMDIDERGETSPRHARADGDVVATRGRRRISATETMVVDLRMYEKAKPPFNLTRARAQAVAKGVDPATVDWQQQRIKYEREPAYEPGLTRLHALGNVLIHDPKQSLNVSAARLDCTFTSTPEVDDEPRIDEARIAGDDAGSPASLEIDDFAIHGRLIELDAGEPFAQVPGAGRLTFNSRTDLDGHELDTPVPIAVTWTQEMIFRGQANRAVFDGAVHAESQDSTLDCQRLTLGFENEEPAVAPAPEGKWWTLKPFFDRGGSESGRAPVAGVRYAKRRLVSLSTTGGSVVLTSNQDEATGQLVSRARLSAEQIDLDLDRKLASVDGAGQLLIEDYRLRQAGSAAPADRTNPFGAIGGGEPSQTYVEWADSMAYNFKYHTANFDNDVMLVHRSGAKLVLAERVLPTAAFDGAQAPIAGKGRDARLTCSSLFVQFKRKDDQGRQRRSGVGSLSGFALDKFQAEDEVYFVDSGVSTTADRITYTQEDTLLSIFGAPALLYDERDGLPKSYFRAPVIYWDRTKNLIEAPKSTIFTR
ncbi:MAG: hypothetical protein JSV19_07890 [Phycisphaerales bacterium]|nr:MAG: hypothetical protein JSV19_07890 [Phycisphaerales bacterium]